MINIQADISGVNQALSLLSNMPGAIKPSQNAAVSRTLQFMKNELARLGSREYYASSSMIKKTLTTSRTSQGGRLISRGKKLTISDYYLSPRRYIKGKRQALSGAVKRTGIKSLGKAFLLPTKSGKSLAFMRTGKGKSAIRQLISPAIPQILGNEVITSELETKTLAKYSERLNYEIMRRLGVS